MKLTYVLGRWKYVTSPIFLRSQSHHIKSVRKLIDTNLNFNFICFNYRHLFQLLSTYHINGAFSLKILSPCFCHSALCIQSSGALSRQDITAAPFQAELNFRKLDQLRSFFIRTKCECNTSPVIAGSISFGLVTISKCSDRNK